MIDYFLVRTMQNVFQSDAAVNSRPMSLYVEHPNDIERQFSNIAYDKGNSKKLNDNANITRNFVNSWKCNSYVHERLNRSYFRERTKFVS